MPLLRSVKIVVTMTNEAINNASTTAASASIESCVDWLTAPGRSTRPPSTAHETTRITPATAHDHSAAAAARGNASEGAPICNGTTTMAIPISSGITNRNTRLTRCSENHCSNTVALLKIATLSVSTRSMRTSTSATRANRPKSSDPKIQSRPMTLWSPLDTPSARMLLGSRS